MILYAYLNDGELISQKVRQLSQWEGQWQLMSLLSHTKSYINNIFGGNIHTLTSSGIRPWRKANDPGYIRKHTGFDVETTEDLQRIAEQSGAVESWIVNEVAMSRRFRTDKLQNFADDVARAIKNNPEVEDATLREMADRRGISDTILNGAAWFMRKSERKLRTRSFWSHYIKAQETLGLGGDLFAPDHPWLIRQANKGVEATQFLYHNACVDKETEVLTINGWKSYSEIEEGETIFSMDDEGNVVPDIINEKHVYREETEVIEFSQSQNNFSMVVTPNHRCSIQLYNSRDQKHQAIREVEADNLKRSHRLLRRPLKWKEEPEPLTDDFVQLCAWVASEGSYGSFTGTDSTARRVTITQSRKANPEYCDEIEMLLVRVGGARHFKYDYHPSSTWTLSGEVREHVVEMMPDKRPTWDLMDRLSVRQMKLFVDTFLKGDGSKNSDVSWVVTQKDPETIEVLQAMAMLAGYTTTNYGENTRGNTVLNITKESKRTDVGPLQKKRSTRNLVWCVTTNTGRWIARREGTTFVTGNSRPAFSRTPLGRIFSRFQLFTWNSVRYRRRVWQQAKSAGYDVPDGPSIPYGQGPDAFQKFQRLMAADMMVLGLASFFPYSLFEASVPPHIEWGRDMASLLFGDSEARERAFFGTGELGPLAPLQAIQPPSGRWMQPLMIAMMNDDWERFTSYHLPVMMPFGRLGRNVYRTYKNPIRVGEEMMGVPVIAAQRKLRELREKEQVAPRPFDLDAHAPRPQTQVDRETGDQSEISETIF